MILRLVRAKLLPGDAVRALRRLADVERVGGGVVDRASGFREDDDRWAILAASVWADIAGLEGRLSARDDALGLLPGAMAIDLHEHYELVDHGAATEATAPQQEATAPRQDAAAPHHEATAAQQDAAEPQQEAAEPQHEAAALGLLTAVIRPGREPEAMRMVEASRQQALAHGATRMYTGRSLVDGAMRLAVLALWRDRASMRSFLRAREETAIDPDFVRLTGAWRLETYDAFDPRRDLPTPPSLAVLVIDEHGRLVDASEAVERVLGMPPELLIGRPVADWVTGGSRDEFRMRLAALHGPGAFQGEVEFARPDGSVARVRIDARGGVPGPGLATAVIAGPNEPMPNPAEFEAGVQAALARPAGRPQVSLPSPRLIAIPSTDLLFARFIERTAGTLGSPSPRRLMLHLRALYPMLAIHRRDLSDERGQTWYVFRDGRLAPRLPTEWWADPALPHALLYRTGTVHEANEAARELFEVDEGVHVTLEALAPPGMADDLRLMLELTRSMSSFDTVLSLRGLRGTAHLVAIHGEVTTRGPSLTLMPVAPAPAGTQLAPICLPAWDDMFIDRVERAAEGLAGRDMTAAATRLEARLRERYPSAVVREGPKADGFGADAAILLVYRDGDRSPYAVDRWWEDASAARVVSLGERFVDANEPALSLFGTTRAALLAATADEFQAPEVLDDARWLRDILVRTGQLHATTWLRRRDGTRIAVEIHAEVRPDGETDTAIRELSPA